MKDVSFRISPKSFEICSILYGTVGVNPANKIKNCLFAKEALLVEYEVSNWWSHNRNHFFEIDVQVIICKCSDMTRLIE